MEHQRYYMGTVTAIGNWLSKRCDLEKSLCSHIKQDTWLISPVSFSGQKNTPQSFEKAAVRWKGLSSDLQPGLQQVSQRKKDGVILNRSGDTWPPQPSQRAKKQIWYVGATLPMPLSLGLRSMSLGATGLDTEKFWRMVVKKRNNSLRAMPSPRQMRFPVGTENEPCEPQGSRQSSDSPLPKSRQLSHSNGEGWVWSLTCYSSENSKSLPKP